ncbi:hypothetical protein AGMMS49944_08700 [Spirochaetia bacterium]|nr:hypothetical protein AGMMS49944_08700 [Spirochaetia bacterium]
MVNGQEKDIVEKLLSIYENKMPGKLGEIYCIKEMKNIAIDFSKEIEVSTIFLNTTLKFLNNARDLIADYGNDFYGHYLNILKEINDYYLNITMKEGEITAEKQFRHVCFDFPSDDQLVSEIKRRKYKWC